MTLSEKNPDLGNHSVSTTGFKPKDYFTSPEKKVKKTRSVREVVNPIFEKCQKMTTDEFWIGKFKQAAAGRFPRGFHFFDNTLTHKKGAKVHSCDLPVNPVEAAFIAMDFFRTYGSIYSPADVIYSAESQARLTEEASVEPITWDGSNNNTKESLIFEYMAEMRKLMGLGNKEIATLRSALMIGISNKIFTSENIIVEDNKIINVEGLGWNPDLSTFYIIGNRRMDSKKSSKPKPSTTSGIIYKEWTKFLSKIAEAPATTKIKNAKTFSLDGLNSSSFNDTSEDIEEECMTLE